MSAPAGQRVIVRALADAVAELPDIIEFDARQVGDADLLICVLGFEERCLAVPQALASAGSRVGAAAICRYATNPSDNELNERPLKDCLAEIAPASPRELSASSGELAAELRALLAEHTSDDSPVRVFLDVSVASNTLIIRALAALLDANVDLHVLYAEADHYRPTRDEYEATRSAPEGAEQRQLAHGVLDVTVASEFPGHHAVALPHRVIVFPGFDRDRVRAAISQVDNDFIMEPDKAPLTWMIGRPLHSEDGWRQAALTEWHDVRSQHEQHVVSTFDYREAMYALEDVHRRYGLQSNLSIVPLGSKMQAIGITLFCLARREVAVVVSQPREYSAAAYTRGCRALWHVGLGRTSDISRSLRAIDTIRLESLESFSDHPQEGQ
ncbi:MAG: hypothetical protein ACLQMH_06115 [Solirubrobacteraceae bacterium]